MPPSGLRYRLRARRGIGFRFVFVELDNQIESQTPKAIRVGDYLGKITFVIFLKFVCAFGVIGQ